jgi:ABC-type Fe3+ transport system substrate-binding protein
MPGIFSRRAAALSIAGIWSLFFHGSAAHGQSIPELYEKAKAEKELLLYTGGPAAPHEARAKLFMQQFPGLSVSVTGGFSNVLNSEIEKQMTAGALAVDMAIFQTVQDFVAWKKRDKLLNFKPEGFEHIYPNMRDPDGAYEAVSVSVQTYAYNTAKLSAADAPQSALDFLKPEFAGNVITCYPADDDATLYLFYLIVQKYGWSWMDKYMANKPNFVQGHLDVSRSVGSGANITTFDATSTIWPFMREGKVGVVFSPVDESPAFTATATIFRDAPHANVAKLYLTWLMAKEQQARTGTFSSRDDVDPPAGFKPLTSYKLGNGYREFVSDAALITDLRKRFEVYTGPPVNKGGVR